MCCGVGMTNASAIQLEYLKMFSLLQDKKAVDITILKVSVIPILCSVRLDNYCLLIETSW